MWAMRPNGSKPNASCLELGICTEFFLGQLGSNGRIKLETQLIVPNKYRSPVNRGPYRQGLRTSQKTLCIFTAIDPFINLTFDVPLSFAVAFPDLPIHSLPGI